MKHISNIIDISLIKAEKDAEKEHEQPQKDSAAVINWLFTELRSNCTAFKQAWPDADSQRNAKKTWLKAFMLAGVNKIEQLQFGLKKVLLMENPFVPSPGQFIAWCKPSPEDIGFPKLEEAYLISIHINRQFSHYKHKNDNVDAVIRHAVEQIGCMSYREMSADNSRKAFNSYYAQALEQFMNGSLQTIAKAIPEKTEPHPQDVPALKLTMAERMNKQEVERLSRGMSLMEYHKHVMSKN